jgi:hypothetical protein
MTSILRGRSDPSATRRMFSGRLETPLWRPSASKANPNFVAITTASRISAMASERSGSGP